MWLSILKELQAKWMVSAYDYLCAIPQLGMNGFKEAGIVVAIEDPDAIAVREKIEGGEDPFTNLESAED